MKLWVVCLLALFLVITEVDGKRKKRREGGPPPPPPSPPPPPPDAPPLLPPGGLPPPMEKKEPKKNYVAWSGIDSNYKPEGTIFEGLTLPTLSDKFLDKFIRPSVIVGKGKGSSTGSESPPKPTMPTIIKDDKKLFLNSIALKQLKMKPQQVVEKVQSYLANPNSIGDELIFNSVLKLVPSAEEEKAVKLEKNIDPSKYSDMDQVVILLSAIPLVREKMNAIRTMATFATDYPSLAAGVEKMIIGIKNVTESSKIAKLIATAAAVGSKVAGKEITFSLDNLLGITSGKSAAFPSITYLHYIAALLNKETPNAADLSQDLAQVEREWGMRKKFLEEETVNLRKQFQEVKALQSKADSTPFFEALNSFVSSSQTKLSTLTDKINGITASYDKLLKKFGMMTVAERKEIDEKRKVENMPALPPQKDLGTVLLEINEALKKASSEISDPKKRPGFLDLETGTLVYTGGESSSNSRPRVSVRGSSSKGTPRDSSSKETFF